MSQIQVDPIHFLLVEDDAEDVRLARRSFAKARIINRLDVVNNGQQALDYLRHRGEYADVEQYPIPDVILLDLNMPVMDGREFIRVIRNDDALSHVPVVIISTSDFERDIEFGRDNGITRFIIKPLQVDNILQLCASLEHVRIVLTRAS